VNYTVYGVILIFVGPQYGTCYISFCRLELCRAPRFFENLCILAARPCNQCDLQAIEATTAMWLHIKLVPQVTVHIFVSTVL
jgi:hypothetical protein